MSLRLYNTLTKTKEDFVPLDKNNVRMYVCGPTVYDYAHIGNARPVIVFDVLFRLLRHLYGADHVTYVRNITDVDDKINARAKQEGISIRELTERTGKIYDEDVAALGNLLPTVTPRATEHIAEMIAMIEALIAAGHAYVADGHVLFDVSSKADYGKLSRRSLDEMIAGSRVEVAPYKKNPMDFVMWKPSDAETPGWDSPWGRGRPGWHIECSAMSARYLGETFDIHGGGIDLVFPHHENEIAQSEGAHHDHPFAKVWMHNGFLQVEGDKMSKSLGNFVTIHDLLKDWPGDVLRFNMLRTHYRQPTDWTVAGLTESASVIRKWSEVFLKGWTRNNLENTPAPSGRFWDALEDDLNTPLAIAELHKLYDWARRFRDHYDHNAVPRFFHALRLLGLEGIAAQADLSEVPTTVFAMGRGNLARSKSFPSRYVSTHVTMQDLTFIMSKVDIGTIDEFIDGRNAARKAKDFKESDRIRDELAAQGVVLKDNPDGTTTWEVKR
ncbi:MAG TPA: cysteine--tRNA ligase [Rhizomicrobium sp.]|jgi:cysteinyl-tRNA synthetase|nr:cysteine--tRNA ligase [Rhizomicrobium sp.]